MTKEIVKYNCPVCGNGLGEEEFFDACEGVNTVANEIAKRTVQERIRELENEYLKEIQRGKRT